MKKKMVHNLKWATAHLSRRLGAGLGARHSDTSLRRVGGARGTQAGRVARRHGAGGMGPGRWGAKRAGRAGAWGERARGASGRERHARQADAGQASGKGARQAGTSCRRAARVRGRQARVARQARGARPAGRPRRAAGPMGYALGALSMF